MQVILIDDDQFIIDALTLMLKNHDDIEVVGTGNDGAAAIELAATLNPDAILMDVRMPKINGIEATKVITSKNPKQKVLILTTFYDDEYIIQALKSGASGYMLKQSNSELIANNLRAIHRGQMVFGEDIGAKLPSLLNQKPTVNFTQHNLTERELAVLEQISFGHSNKEIAAALFLSEGTVRNYISILLDKLELRDRTQLAIFYLQNQ
ncbi:response regulator transcription factor [Culicoidibacter larvae]|uniref:Response regulator transcription factor n=1 Tax=Culicoidibacter larvae TaxID=2579976 RepID=A0A5R8QFP5_9FIRM|nr:response regulator transcription factor [Culicoidibacter larvae]TLG76580.1 response regulator transcription factor [Culicoidibacter larvae]